MTFNWRSYIDAVSANVQRLYSKDTGVSGLLAPSAAPVKTGAPGAALGGIGDSTGVHMIIH